MILSFVNFDLGTVITIALAFGSAAGGWFFGRKKSIAETTLIEKKALLLDREANDKVFNFYKDILENNEKVIKEYIVITEENRREIRDLKKVVDKLIDKACLRVGCSNREYFDLVELKKDLGKINVQFSDSKTNLE